MTEYKNRQRRIDIHISGVLEEKTKQKRENAIELVVKTFFSPSPTQPYATESQTH